VGGLREFEESGEAVQVEQMKPVLKVPGTSSKRVKPKYDKLLSNVAFKVNLRRYKTAKYGDEEDIEGRGLHSFTFQLNLSSFCHCQTDGTQRVPHKSV